MADLRKLGRWHFLGRLAGSLVALRLASCDRLSESPDFTKILDRAEAVSRFVQKALTAKDSLAREYTEADLSAEFGANGTTEPSDRHYQRLAGNGFVDWRLVVGGLVTRQAKFSLAKLKEMPSRTQITRHDCVED